MEKKWRPNDWKTEVVKKNPLHCFAPQDCADYFFEAGANAMLDALKKEGEYIENGKFYCSPCGGCGNDEDCSAYTTGWLVFIPSEEA